MPLSSILKNPLQSTAGDIGPHDQIIPCSGASILELQTNSIAGESQDPRGGVRVGATPESVAAIRRIPVNT